MHTEVHWNHRTMGHSEFYVQSTDKTFTIDVGGGRNLFQLTAWNQLTETWICQLSWLWHLVVDVLSPSIQLSSLLLKILLAAAHGKCPEWEWTKVSALLFVCMCKFLWVLGSWCGGIRLRKGESLIKYGGLRSVIKRSVHNVFTPHLMFLVFIFSA